MGEAESWKSLEGIVDGGEKYEVSTLGRVRNKRTERMLKPVLTKKGYGRVTIRYKGVSKLFLIHRLVALAFLPQDTGKSQVNHVSGIKTDNRLCNLEWVSPSENIKHAFEKGLKINNNKKAVTMFDLNGNSRESYESIMEAAQHTGLNETTIALQCRRKSKSRSNVYFRFTK